jgi:uncharacterized protein (DUF433 family)
MKTLYIQSYYQYPVTFSSIGKTIPARSAQGELRNVAEFTEKEIDTLKKREPLFRELVDKKKIRVLDHLPSSYVPPAQRINEANDEAEKLRQENEALKARLKVLEGGTAVVKGDEVQPFSDDEVIDVKADEMSDEDRKKQYESMTYAELQDACKYAGIEYKNKKKAELIKALVDLNNK